MVTLQTDGRLRVRSGVYLKTSPPVRVNAREKQKAKGIPQLRIALWKTSGGCCVATMRPRIFLVGDDRAGTGEWTGTQPFEC